MTRHSRVTDNEVMTLVRHELLNTLFNTYPLAHTRPQLLSDLRPVFSHRDKAWLTDAIGEQLKILQHAGLIRPASGGFTLTERGRRDRQQAAAMFNTKHKEKAA